MKSKLLISISVIFFFILTSISFAELSPEQTAIGGIKIGDKMSKVIKIYGQPKNVNFKVEKSAYDGSEYTVQRMYYGTSFEILIIHNTVYEVKSSGRNGIKTALGVKVGDSVQEMINAYGSTDSKHSDNGFEYYFYGVVTDDSLLQLIFKAKDNVIVEIYNTTN